jgi:hypothetical protein
VPDPYLPPQIYRLKRAFRKPDPIDHLPRVGEVSRLDEWSADIRQIDLLGELMQGVHILPDAAARSVSLQHIELDHAAGCFAAHPVCTLSRPSRDVFEGPQLTLVSQWAELRGERMTEILDQINVPLQYWSALVDLNPTSHRHSLEWIHLALELAYRVLQPIKHHLGCPRPASYAPGIQPIIRPRRFAAFPSGHATEAFLVARLLAHLAGHRKGSKAHAVLETQLQSLAARIANNRVVAGVHFHIDSVAGRVVAESLAEYFIQRCDPSQAGWLPRCYDAAVLKPTDAEAQTALDRHQVLDGAQVKDQALHANKAAKPIQLPPPNGSLLQHLWQQAQTEWR